jgi:hypothetical protein
MALELVHCRVDSAFGNEENRLALVAHKRHLWGGGGGGGVSARARARVCVCVCARVWAAGNDS